MPGKPRKLLRYPTVEELNALPPHMREYMHDLSSVEIQHAVRQLREIELQNEQLIAKIELLKKEAEWHEIAKEGEPPRGIPVLLWDTVHNTIRVGWVELSGWHFQGDKGEKFIPHKWQKIRY